MGRKKILESNKRPNTGVKIARAGALGWAFIRRGKIEPSE